MPTDRRYAACLFDMDGTILTSLAATERVWGAWAVDRGLDPVALLPTIHGIRAEDTVARLALPGIDPKAEAERITAAEMACLDGIAALAGAPGFLRSLPSDRWAIVTSAPRDLARHRLAASGLPLPRVLVAAEDVARGKPSPEGYRKAAAALGVAPGDCLAFEDSPAGIAAAEAAAMDVVVVTSCQPHPVVTRHRTIADFEDAAVRGPFALIASRLPSKRRAAAGSPSTETHST